MIVFSIRRATKADARLIADISRETFLETFAVHNTEQDMHKFMSEQFSTEMLMDEVGVAGNIFLVAESQGSAAGYVFLKLRAEKTMRNKNALEISRLYVRKQFIGAGAGKQLMQAALQEATDLNRSAIWLGVWEHNHHAIRFYQSFGFRKFGEHDFLLGNDLQRDWLMEKVISN